MMVAGGKKRHVSPALIDPLSSEIHKFIRYVGVDLRWGGAGNPMSYPISLLTLRAAIESRLAPSAHL